MRLIVSLFLVSLALLAEVQGYIPPPHDRLNHLSKCKDPSTGQEYGHGSVWYNDKRCERYTCKIGNTLSFWRRTERCPLVDVRLYCKVIRRRGSYPDCCPYLSCPE